jgi:hypothetical protein
VEETHKDRLVGPTHQALLGKIVNNQKEPIQLKRKRYAILLIKKYELMKNRMKKMMIPSHRPKKEKVL